MGKSVLFLCKVYLRVVSIIKHTNAYPKLGKIGILRKHNMYLHNTEQNKRQTIPIPD